MAINARFNVLFCALVVSCLLLSVCALPAAGQNPPGTQPLHNQDVLAS